MTTSTASARRRAPSGLRRTVGGFPLWFFGSMMAMGIVAATVGLSQPASPSIGAPFSSVFAPARAILGIVYWTVLTLVGSTMVVKVRNGAVYGSFIAFVVAAAVLGGPPAAVVVGLVGTLELRELRELRPPQIATNHVEPVVGAVVASFAAGWVAEGLTQTSIGSAALAALIVTATATLAFMLPSTALAYVGLALRRRRSLREVAREQLGTILLFSLVAAATAWVMVETYVLVAWWSPIVILGPVLASWLALDRDRARWQADHDPLTQLANRSLFEGKLAVAERRARRDSRSSLILFVDLDGFKAVNDEHGHSVGDDVLRAVARRLEGAIRRGDVVARLGGDEFAVLMWDIADPQLAERTAARLRLELAQPTSSGPIEISIGASVGTSILSREMPAAADAMRLADASLYMDKRKRSGG